MGIVPIENSTDGRVADTLDMFTRLPAHICGEVQLRIHHNLLGKCSRAEVEEVYSKPQALSQCRNWLARHLPSARTIEVTSTSTAAQLAQDKPGAAAIASLQAGVHYGLDVLAGRHRRQPRQSHAFRGDRRRDGPAHRQRQVRADVRDRASTRGSGRRYERLQAKSPESDLDRVVPDRPPGRRLHVFRGARRDTKPTTARTAPSRRWSAKQCVWRCWAPTQRWPPSSKL